MHGREAGKIRERHHEPLEREEYRHLVPILQTELTQIRQTILSRQVVMIVDISLICAKVKKLEFPDLLQDIQVIPYLQLR
jgi:hypothetical protein